jgi:dihydrolipoamide dehydrogenase
MMPNVVPTLHEPVITDAVRVALEKQGITVMTGVGIESIKVQEDGSVLSTLSNGDKLTSEKVLVAIGRMLNTNNLELENAGVECDKKGVIITDKHMRTNVSNIFAAGDVTTGPQLAHKAQRQGLVAAETIAGHEACMNYNVIPSTIFIEPQISIVGVTQTEAEKAGITTVCGTLPYSANEKAVALQKTEGIIKVVARADDHRIIGVQIFGHEAGNLISELCVVVEHEHTLEDVVNTEHPHPTITELVMEVCKDALGLAFHLQK